MADITTRPAQLREIDWHEFQFEYIGTVDSGVAVWHATKAADGTPTIPTVALGMNLGSARIQLLVEAQRKNRHGDLGRLLRSLDRQSA